MIEVSVMYSDLSVKRGSLAEIEKLPKDRVLFMSVRDAEVEGKAGNVSLISGFDKYALAHKVDEGKDWVMLTGWDDDAFVWRQVGCQGCKEKVVVNAPLGVLHVVFYGQQVSNAQWEKAIKRVDKEMV